ncbi:MAG: hypothetical protein GY702_10195, partial [Desulfobulbaceae bacterium]|nr:hypothetical protein [Desulfobulbaceae bacterium]
SDKKLEFKQNENTKLQRNSANMQSEKKKQFRQNGNTKLQKCLSHRKEYQEKNIEPCSSNIKHCNYSQKKTQIEIKQDDNSKSKNAQQNKQKEYSRNNTTCIGNEANQVNISLENAKKFPNMFSFHSNSTPKMSKHNILKNDTNDSNDICTVIIDRKLTLFHTNEENRKKLEQANNSRSVKKDNSSNSRSSTNASKHLMNTIEKVQINPCKRKQAFNDNTKPRIIKTEQATDVLAAKIVKDNSRKRKQGC